jgi:hypothetical protein
LTAVEFGPTSTSEPGCAQLGAVVGPLVGSAIGLGINFVHGFPEVVADRIAE